MIIALSDSSLYDEKKRKPDSNLKNLIGNLVAQCDLLKDEAGNWGYFFVFPDLCCRWTGHFKLRFVVNDLYRGIKPSIIFSDIFTVYSPKYHPGMLRNL